MKNTPNQLTINKRNKGQSYYGQGRYSAKMCPVPGGCTKLIDWVSISIKGETYKSNTRATLNSEFVNSGPGENICSAYKI